MSRTQVEHRVARSFADDRADAEPFHTYFADRRTFDTRRRSGCRRVERSAVLVRVEHDRGDVAEAAGAAGDGERADESRDASHHRAGLNEPEDDVPYDGRVRTFSFLPS